jgi:hypothetical protein
VAGVDGDAAAAVTSTAGTTKRHSVVSRYGSGMLGRAQAVRNSVGTPTVSRVRPTLAGE